MSVAFGWENILDDDEKIRCQGRPDGSFPWEMLRPMGFGTGIFFMGFSVFWMNMAAMGGGNFWVFGFAFIGIAFYKMIGAHLWKSYMRRNTYYTLTNKRAFIASETFGRRDLKPYPITGGTPLTIEGSDPATVIFARKTRRENERSDNDKIGFERIFDSQKVYGLIRDIQKEAE